MDRNRTTLKYWQAISKESSHFWKKRTSLKRVIHICNSVDYSWHRDDFKVQVPRLIVALRCSLINT